MSECPQREEKSPYHLDLKIRGAKFHEFLQPTGFKTWKIKRLADLALGELGGQGETDLLPLKRQHHKQPIETQHRGSSWKGDSGICD